MHSFGEAYGSPGILTCKWELVYEALSKEKGDVAFYKNKYASDKCASLKDSRNCGIKVKLATKVLRWEISLRIFLNSLSGQRDEGVPKQKLNASRRASFVIAEKYLLQEILFQVQTKWDMEGQQTAELPKYWFWLPIKTGNCFMWKEGGNSRIYYLEIRQMWNQENNHEKK